jgi:two-component system, sensor histidine kinase and response regulator
MPTYAGLVGTYDYRLVALSVFVAILASYAAFDLADQLILSNDRRRSWWLCGVSVVLGLGIWGTHSIGMEAFHLPIPVQYDWPTVLVSIAVAVLASAAALYTVGRRARRLLSTLLACVLIGLGIAATHYIGMAAMRLPVVCVYSPKVFSLSILVSIGLSFVHCN